MKSNIITTYLQDSIADFRRVTWPTRHQAIKLSGIVLGLLLASAVFVAILDFVFNQGYKYLLSIH